MDGREHIASFCFGKFFKLDSGGFGAVVWWDVVQVLSEPGVLKGLLGSDTLIGVINEDLLEKIQE